MQESTPEECSGSLSSLSLFSLSSLSLLSLFSLSSLSLLSLFSLSSLSLPSLFSLSLCRKNTEKQVANSSDSLPLLKLLRSVSLPCFILRGSVRSHSRRANLLFSCCSGASDFMSACQRNPRTFKDAQHVYFLLEAALGGSLVQAQRKTRPAHLASLAALPGCQRPSGDFCSGYASRQRRPALFRIL